VSGFGRFARFGVRACGPARRFVRSLSGVVPVEILVVILAERFP